MRKSTLKSVAEAAKSSPQDIKPAESISEQKSEKESMEKPGKGKLKKQKSEQIIQTGETTIEVSKPVIEVSEPVSKETQFEAQVDDAAAKEVIAKLDKEPEAKKNTAEIKKPAAPIAQTAPETPVVAASKKSSAVKKSKVETVANATATSENTKSSGTTTNTKKITFRVRFHTKMGQSLSVVGNHTLLGNGDQKNAFPLQYLNNDFWEGTIEISKKDSAASPITYNYLFKYEDGVVVSDWGSDKLITADISSKDEVLLIDAFDYSGFTENSFYTEPFKKVLLKNNYTKVNIKQPKVYTHTFKVKAPLLPKGHVLCIAGSSDEIGNWDKDRATLMLRNEGEDWWTARFDLSNTTFPVRYKYGVFNVAENKLEAYESYSERTLVDTIENTKQTIVTDGFAVLPNNTFKGAGVAIPVFSLRSNNGLGVGEFNDLKLLIDWGKLVGLKVIQILPVNDTSATGTFADSYPYAAISAFALHPLYLHLPAIVTKKNKALISETEQIKNELNALAEVDYEKVISAKLNFIKKVFALQKKETFKSADFITFYETNAHWLVPYAAFSYLRDQNKTSDFSKWSNYKTYNSKEISAFVKTPAEADDEVAVHYFIQYHLHLQLKEAAEYAHANGIIVKGDIPIGIYRYSCDAWQQPELYNMDLQAGAPPDDFAVKGQNWGFPTYNWQQMMQDGFSWWKKRFKQMSYYFDAFRIDHILGFFRIWSIPVHAVEGIMGYFAPALPVEISELSQRGIGNDIKRFTSPFINDAVLSEVFAGNVDEAKQTFLEAGESGNYSLKAEFNTQKKVEAHFAEKEQTTANKTLKEGLFDLISNVILFEVEGSNATQFHFRISMDHTSSYKFLPGDVKYSLHQLYIDYFYQRQDAYWKIEAMEKLPELKRSTNMLICGEDLGMVPHCVPGVMKELAILSLEIQRMPKDPKREFFHPNDAPYLSVVTPSTHDMSTIRGWWEEDRAKTQRFYNYELGQWGNAPYFCEPWVNKAIIIQHLYSPAMWSIFQLQDLMGIDGQLRRENPNDERINIPADPKHYWRYRMHLTLEQLLTEDAFNKELADSLRAAGR